MDLIFTPKGYDDREFSNVPSRRDCEEMCLRERSFKCRSAEFDTVALTCTLSRETRRTKPKSFREARNIDYLENGCIDSSECIALSSTASMFLLLSSKTAATHICGFVVSSNNVFASNHK